MATDYGSQSRIILGTGQDGFRFFTRCKHRAGLSIGQGIQGFRNPMFQGKLFKIIFNGIHRNGILTICNVATGGVPWSKNNKLSMEIDHCLAHVSSCGEHIRTTARPSFWTELGFVVSSGRSWEETNAWFQATLYNQATRGLLLQLKKNSVALSFCFKSRE
eukprot:scaffold1863_cov85-Cylindrotheca_fusiformis.AAC.5